MNEQALTQEQVEVLARIRSVAGRHAEVIAELVALLAHAKAIAAAEALGHGSLFDYCRKVLNLSRDQAYRYLACADVVTKQPQVLDALKASRLNPTGVATLAAYVKTNSIEDGARALEEAEGKTVEAIELLVAQLCPKPDVKLSVRPSLSRTASAQHALLHDAATQPNPAAASPTDPADPTGMRATATNAEISVPPLQNDGARMLTKVVPLSPESYKLTMTVSAEAYSELQELRDLVSHIIPSGQLDKVVVHSIRIALKQARKAKWKISEKHAGAARAAAAEATRETSSEKIGVETGSMTSSTKPSPAGRLVNRTMSRYPSDPLRRAVYIRDGGRCAFVGAEGRCDSTWQVEVDHVIRVADGGATTLSNLRLCCRSHNQAREVAA